MILQPDIPTEKLIDEKSLKKLKKDFKQEKMEVKRLLPEKPKKRVYRTGR